MRERLSDYQEKYGDLYNLEATPAESTTYRFAKHDKAQFPDIITANENGTPYYTNSSHLPVGYTEDIFSALDIQDELQTLYTSGTVFHAFLGEKLPDWKACADLVRKIAENYKLPYYTMSPTYSVCADHGYIRGEHFTCPECGRKTEVYSRITGYYRPVQNWNDGKAQEFKDRKTYVIERSCLTHDGVLNPADHEEAPAADEEARTLLFVSKTCPNCRMAKTVLDNAGVAYEEIVADDDVDSVHRYNVTQAPTLVLTGEDGAKSLKGVSEILGWLRK
jgi:ribonucleoside-triphosphate reductase